MTNAVIEGRLRKNMADLPPHSSVQRIALGDVAFPASREENQRLAGFTLLMVVAVTHDATELPPSVFFRDPDGDFELQALLSRIGTLDAPELREVFGPYRFDGLYVIPLQATQIEGAVMANFQMKSRDFKLLTFPSDALPPGVEVIPTGAPDVAALHSFAQREFPIIDERALESAVP